MTTIRLITTVATPLDRDDRLIPGALRRHLDQQWDAGIDGVLVGGSMGVMQALTDAMYRDLLTTAAEHERSGKEMLVGIGDVSLCRTLERLAFANTLPIDGVVALPPFFVSCPQAELTEYFHRIADASAVPLYLYDLPQRVGYSLEPQAVMRSA